MASSNHCPWAHGFSEGVEFHLAEIKYTAVEAISNIRSSCGFWALILVHEQSSEPDYAQLSGEVVQILSMGHHEQNPNLIKKHTNKQITQ